MVSGLGFRVYKDHLLLLLLILDGLLLLLLA
jgi:hypothetical protein